MNILVIQNRMGIGDMVIFLPFVEAISKKYKISIFPIQESEWLDLGTWNKF